MKSVVEIILKQCTKSVLCEKGIHVRVPFGSVPLGSSETFHERYVIRSEKKMIGKKVLNASVKEKKREREENISMELWT